MNYYNYFTEIEDTFIRRRAKSLLLSPIDWAMIESWQERGIPLHVVLRSIETVFDGFDKKPSTRSIKGLLYCREEIEAQYDEWLKMQAGKAGDTTPAQVDESFSRENISAHIGTVIDFLQNSDNNNLLEAFGRAAARLEELRANLTDDFEVVDKTLADIEKFIDQALLTNSDKTHLKKLEKEIADQLKAYKKGMEPDVYKTTFDLMLLKRIREEKGIPRLSLFYL
ncbi:MAG: hypothetical protein H7070_16465 [Saprospiraceae bacterium]|nr:hypothetical protein [Pyrinomonadaceae bacterium]